MISAAPPWTGVLYSAASRGGSAHCRLRPLRVRLSVRGIAARICACHSATPCVGSKEALMERPGLVRRQGHAVTVPGIGPQSFRAHGIDQAEIHGLGGLPFGPGHLVPGLVEEEGSGQGMEILARLIRRQHPGIATEFGHDPQFNLRVVGDDQEGPGWRDEAAAKGRAPGNLLQVGITTGEPTRRRSELPVGGVNSAGRWMDMGR